MREGPRDLGYVEGRNITLDARWSEGSRERLIENVEEFVRQKVDLIITHGVRGTLVAKTATTTIPIVVAAADMVGAGVVASLARPGGNITGNRDQPSEVSLKEIEPTRFELVVNLKTAKALGIAVPAPLRLRVDRVLE